MRFFLDQNVDARVGTMLRAAGHNAWTADDSGLAAEADPNLSIYAQERRAVLVTHDREFSVRARQRITGQHIWLNCKELSARDIFGAQLVDLVAVLERHDALYIVVAQDGFKVTYPNQTWGRSP